jgi:hypothetical protein
MRIVLFQHFAHHQGERNSVGIEAHEGAAHLIVAQP